MLINTLRRMGPSALRLNARRSAVSLKNALADAGVYSPLDVASVDLQRWLASFDSVAFDMDGVLWRGDEPIAHAGRCIRALQHLGKQTLFITNNSAMHSDGYEARFKDFDIPYRREDIITAAKASALYLQQLRGRMKGKPFHERVFMIGGDGLERELTDVGFTVDRDPSPILPAAAGERVTLPSYDAVLVGRDTVFSYNHLHMACHILQTQPQCLLIAANPDVTRPIKNGNFVPSAGALAAAVQAGSERDIDVTAGKPSLGMLETLAASHSIDPPRTLMVGDRLNTDIDFGRRGGMQTLLVLSGCTQTVPPKQPLPADAAQTDWWVDSLTRLYHLLRPLVPHEDL